MLEIKSTDTEWKKILFICKLYSKRVRAWVVEFKINGKLTTLFSTVPYWTFLRVENWRQRFYTIEELCKEYYFLIKDQPEEKEELETEKKEMIVTPTIGKK